MTPENNNLLTQLVEVMNQPDPAPFLFFVGQNVRVLKSVTYDGQTPQHWAGAIATVIERKSGSLHKDHWYKLTMLVDGLPCSCDFREEELDYRYVQRNTTGKER